MGVRRGQYIVVIGEHLFPFRRPVLAGVVPGPAAYAANDCEGPHPSEGMFHDDTKANYYFLADKGLTGNGHMMMLESNSTDIAALITEWINAWRSRRRHLSGLRPGYVLL